MSRSFPIPRVENTSHRSGANLAAVLALKAAERDPQPKILLQLLIVPVTDNTADVNTLWKSNEHAPWLTPQRMLWFRNNYLPDAEAAKQWEASPAFAPKELLRKTPKAWIAAAELDILKDEAVEYGELLRREGVEADVQIYRGAPHPFMAMAGTLFPFCYSFRVSNAYCYSIG